MQYAKDLSHCSGVFWKDSVSVGLIWSSELLSRVFISGLARIRDAKGQLQDQLQSISTSYTYVFSTT